MNNEIKKIFTDLSGKDADLIVLILTSQNIRTRIERQDSHFNIFVDPGDAPKSLALVEIYKKENQFFRIRQKIQNFPISSFKSYPAFFIMGILWLVHAVCLHYQIHEEMILKYGASALFILQGETHRAITALFLHSDVRHLTGNMAGMLIFGAPFISLSGYGTGPFLLLFSGTLGNLINAHLYRSAHLSIGASTAVMAAAGCLAAFQLTHKKKPVRLNNPGWSKARTPLTTPEFSTFFKQTFRNTTLMPLFAGALLVGMFSQGENTDIWAHVFGFICGLLCGIIFFPLNRTLQFQGKEPAALAVTLIIIISAVVSATL